MSWFIKFHSIFLLISVGLSGNYVDLEEAYYKSFILETKRIEIPGFPYGFNPSLISWKGKYLLSFRAGKDYVYDCEPYPKGPCEPDPCESNWLTTSNEYSPNRIVLVWLDRNFEILSKPQILDLPNDNPTYRQQDPRLTVVGDRVYCVYSDVVKGIQVESTRRMFVAELLYEKGSFYIENTECLSDFENVREKRWEKNWAPFAYDDNLLLAYSINPHRIMYPMLGTGVCSTVALTENKIDWKWGELRGGTPAILIGDEYLAFFHSATVFASKQSRGEKMQHYVMGAYTFSAEPPFRLTRISDSPIVGKNFYTGVQYKTWKPLHVVFPGGLVVDDNCVYVAYGRQDHEIWIAKMNKKQLLDSLVPVLPK